MRRRFLLPLAIVLALSAAADSLVGGAAPVIAQGLPRLPVVIQRAPVRTPGPSVAAVRAAMPALEFRIDAAELENVPKADDMKSTWSSLNRTLATATVATGLAGAGGAHPAPPGAEPAVVAHYQALTTTVSTALAAHRCGHNVGSGHVIVVSISLEEAVFYLNGCAVNSTPVTTGRPALRTPLGHFSIFRKAAPLTFTSPWPKGSPYWYPTTTVPYAMEFYGGAGIYFHYWPPQPAGSYGPGSENNPAVDSHGCVHLPLAVMAWAYRWAPIGTAVTIQQ